MAPVDAQVINHGTRQARPYEPDSTSSDDADALLEKPDACLDGVEALGAGPDAPLGGADVPSEGRGAPSEVLLLEMSRQVFIFLRGGPSAGASSLAAASCPWPSDQDNND
ncbi:hypothetical protein PCASD_15520 [Puccinia coronata f. sp. avenae]|uniref:Uncharacterized protein n=1 Tax=Puccinia coronata f. sp. avenae TaxID=200324 RepID=A0A2N5UCB5_9BASI|nr:hypothetical protein PCASD_15520 [Puccinia coronata f. sp. avenae]